MATAAARSLLRSPAARSAAARLASQPKSARSPFRLPSRNQRLSRSPVEMSACVVSLQPYHTATASALMMSMLTVSRCGFGWLPDEFNMRGNYTLGYHTYGLDSSVRWFCDQYLAMAIELSFAVLHISCLWL